MKEVIYKQWHNEDLSFHLNFKPSFSMCTPVNHNLSWWEILRITTDYAGEDFTQRGMSWEFLQEHGMAMIVSRISHHVYKMPAFEQQLTLHTWESAGQGPFCTRNFKIVDSATGELLISATTLWLCFDIINKKILLGKDFPFRPAPTEVFDFEGIKPGKIKIPENMEVLGKHKILYSELDSNGHTNNSNYIKFAIDVLPKEFQMKQIKDLRLNYSKEALLDDELELKGHFDPETNKYTIQGLVNTDSSFECELYFQAPVISTVAKRNGEIPKDLSTTLEVTGV